MSKKRGIQLENGSGTGEVMDLKIVPVRASGKIISGLSIGNTLEQNKACILIAHPGDFKFMPILGVGIEDVLLDESNDLLDYRHKIREHMAMDGLKVSHLDFYQKSKLNITADYE